MDDIIEDNDQSRSEKLLSSSSKREGPPTCCCCLPRRTGILILGWMGAITGALRIAVSLARLAFLDEDETPEDRDKADQDAYFDIIRLIPEENSDVAVIVVYNVTLFFDILLLMGTYRKIPTLLLLYIVWNFNPVITNLIVSLLGVTDYSMYGIAVTGAVISVTVNTYCLGIVYFYYKELLQCLMYQQFVKGATPVAQQQP